jgi:hypothetical protein
MTLQNRVTPFGEIVATPERGTLMGNRGCLHDTERRIVKSSARVAWVTCRLERAWAAGVEGRPGEVALVQNIDPVIKLDRVERKGAQRRFTSRAGGLPDGTFVPLPDEEGIARLKWRGLFLKWSPTGYGHSRAVEAKTTITVLTPACTVKVLGAGYVPEVHATAG